MIILFIITLLLAGACFAAMLGVILIAAAMKDMDVENEEFW